jgi:hypothetical protein
LDGRPAAESAFTITATARWKSFGTPASAAEVASGSKSVPYALARLPSAVVSGDASLPSTMNQDASGHCDSDLPMRTAAAAIAPETGELPLIESSNHFAVSFP